MKEWFTNSTAFEKFCAVAFVFLATLSCIATAQSLCLTLGLEYLPKWITFILALFLAYVVYALTSYLLVQIINCLNDKYCAKKNIKIPERRNTIIGSILGVILLWIVCSMPTNTHSMFYVDIAKDVATAELENQLQVFKKASITNKSSLYNRFYTDSVEMRRYFKSIKDDLDFEVNREDDEGFGKQARRIVKKVQSRYKNEISKLHFVFETPRSNGRVLNNDQLLAFYKEQLDNLSNQLANDMFADYVVRQNNLQTETADIRQKIDQIEKMLTYIKKNGSGIGDAKKIIDEGYNQQSYKEQILNNVEVLKEPSKRHEAKNIKKYNIYRIDRLYSVFNVWGDFFNDKLPEEYDMSYWILWSLILDIAALIFSGIAFRGKIKKI